MSDKLDIKLMTLHSAIVSIKLTDAGFEYLRNFYLSTYPETGYQMFNHFKGKIREKMDELAKSSQNHWEISSSLL